MIQTRSQVALAEQLLEAVRWIDGVSFETDLARYRLPESEADWLRPEPYYKELGAYVKLAGVRNVLEIGTLFGGSAIALAKFADRVVTADVELGPAERAGLFRANIRPYRCQGPEDCLSIPLAGFDLVFVDMDHSGHWERRLNERFGREYGGVVFYDDIALNDPMRTFWQEIEFEKVSLPWHHSGFGAVRYPGTM